MSEGAAGKSTNRRQAVIIFVVACIAAWALEIAAEHALEHKGSMAGPLFDLGGIYQQVITSGPRKPVQKFTVLVDARAEDDRYYSGLTNGVLNPCERRAPLAALIRQIARAQPSVIVLDYSFHANQCAASDQPTAALQSAIADTSATIPVVYGRRVAPDRSLAPSLTFSATPRPLLGEGLIEFDPDTRRLPLNWAVHPDQRGRDNAGWMWIDTLALRAAESQNARLKTSYVRLAHFLNAQRDNASASGRQAVHPYVSFLEMQKMTMFAAGEVLCGARYTLAPGGADAAPCVPSGSVLQALRGRIVVIGESGPADTHDSVIGKVPGFVLQANYIEALLDERYYAPAPQWVDLLFGLLIFIALTAAAELSNGLKMIALWAATLVGAYVSIYFTIMHLGYYTNPVTISLFALVITLGHKVQHAVKPLAMKAFTLISRRSA